MTQRQSKYPTPFAVHCPNHGKVFLTKEEYRRQLMKPDQRWICPVCNEVSSWDDENYERALEEERKS